AVQRRRPRHGRAARGVRFRRRRDSGRARRGDVGQGARIDPDAVRRAMRRVIVLRPEPGASATVGRARRRGIEAVALPLFETEPIAWEAPDPARFDALLLTSANAVRLGGDQLDALRALPVHAVGEATAYAAREAGFEVASISDAGVDRLVAS